MNTTAPSSQVPLWRKIVSGVLGVAGSVSLVIEAGHNAWKVLIPILALVIAAVVVHRPTLGPQVLARAIWWSNLGLGALLCIIGGGGERNAGVVLTWGCGLALLIISRKGLAEASERASGFAPAAFRSSLLLLMILALADAQSFLLFGFIERTHIHFAAGSVLMLAGVAFFIGFVGLYRLKPWGAIVNVVTALSLLLLIGSKQVEPSHDIGPVLLVLAGVQVLAAAPMLLTMLTKAKLPSTSPRFRGVLAAFALALVMAAATVSAFHRNVF